MRNPQSTLKNAIQREMHSARRNTTLPRVRLLQTEQQPDQIQQTGFTLNPKALFQKKSSEPEQKRQIIVNSAAQSSGPQYKTAVPVPEAKPGQSEIQRQLEALYRRDGRQMPPMSMEALPKTAGNAGSGRGTVNTNPAPQQTPAATATPAPQQAAPQNSAPRNVIVAPQQNVAQDSEDKKKWYEMFLPSKTKKSPKRLPKSNQIAKKAPVDNSVTESIEQPATPVLAPAPAPENQPVAAGPEQPVATPESVAKTMTPAVGELDEDELEELREEAEERLEEQRIAAEKRSKEAAAELPAIVENTPESGAAKVAINPEDEFEDLFPEMSEEEADSMKKTKVVEKAASTPFSGLALEEEGLKKTAEKPAETETPTLEKTPQVAQEKPAKEFNPFEPQPQPTAPKVAKEVNPFEVPVEKVVDKPEMPAENVAETEKPAAKPEEKIVENTPEKPVEDNPFQPQTEQKLDTPTPAPEKQIAASEHESSIDQKLALIASRGNIKGLKGFCPVALRDSRLLVDARPEFSSSYKSMNYQFASLENKLKFDREPAKYAPAAGGSDLVMLVDKQDDQEGTLDFASWYKGRLYLFSSKTTMNVFMKTPALYVGVE
ncbi:hypothetical protein [Gimesia algae]|uniref:hypothetical protein n=1 Tax=Gimesia algae TaxID=2527971 RepID=UPI00119EAAD1|nr:hypothetical protein [Gimesia algae]